MQVYYALCMRMCKAKQLPMCKNKALSMHGSIMPKVSMLVYSENIMRCVCVRCAPLLDRKQTLWRTVDIRFCRRPTVKIESATTKCGFPILSTGIKGCSNVEKQIVLRETSGYIKKCFPQYCSTLLPVLAMCRLLLPALLRIPIDRCCLTVHKSIMRHEHA